MTSLVFGICLRAAPQRVCRALADPVLVPDWLCGMQAGPAGEEDPGRLTCEWLLADCLEINGGCASVVRFDLVAVGEVTRLTVSHRGLDPGGSLLKALRRLASLPSPALVPVKPEMAEPGVSPPALPAAPVPGIPPVTCPWPTATTAM
jgi:hypothetical protein